MNSDHEIQALIDRLRNQIFTWRNHILDATDEHNQGEITRAQLKTREKHLKEQIDKAEAEIEDLEAQLMSRSTETNIHIMTSVKGGVGKTLLSAAVMCSYLNPERHLGNRKILGVDMNSMNIDLYRLIAESREGAPIESLPWRQSKVDERGRCCVVVRSVPYSIPEGVEGFWGSLAEVIQHPLFREHDVVVDTNLHVANLIEGDGNPEQIIRQLISRTSRRKLFVWLLWTFASLRDPAFVEVGINNLEIALGDELQDRVHFVHVLNPSALTPPHGDFEDELQSLVDVRETERLYKQLIERMPPEDPKRIQLETLRDDHIRDQIGAVDWSKLQPGDLPQPFPGLHELIELEDATMAMSYWEFIQKVGRTIVANPNVYLKDLFDLIYRNEFEGRGRPWNLLPISIHNPGLKGFTEVLEFYIPGNLNSLRERIATVEKDVGKFLEDLSRRL